LPSHRGCQAAGRRLAREKERAARPRRPASVGLASLLDVEDFELPGRPARQMRTHATGTRERPGLARRPRTMRRFLFIGLVSVLVVACSQPGPEDASATVVGRLVAGPTCPVETDPPDPACEPRPVADAEIVATSEDGAEIGTRSEEDGTFRLTVPPGEVTIVFGEVEGLLMAPDQVTVVLDDDETLDLGEIAYDTGIR